MDFLYLIRILLKRKWIIIGAGLLAAVIAWALTIHQPRKYLSFSQISTGFTVNDEVKLGNDNVDIFAADIKFNNVIVTLSSPTVISLLSYNLILHDLNSPRPFRRLTPQKQQSSLYKNIDKAAAAKIFQDKLETMSILTSFKDEERDLQEFLALYGYDYKSLSSTLAIYRLQRTDYIEIDFVSENPELSAFVVNTIFPQFLRYYKNVRSSKSTESIDTLQSLMERKNRSWTPKIPL